MLGSMECLLEDSSEWAIGWNLNNLGLWLGMEVLNLTHLPYMRSTPKNENLFRLIWYSNRNAHHRSANKITSFYVLAIDASFSLGFVTSKLASILHFLINHQQNYTVLPFRYWYWAHSFAVSQICRQNINKNNPIWLNELWACDKRLHSPPSNKQTGAAFCHRFFISNWMH